MYNGRIILNNYSKGSFGNIFTDSQSNIYKVTTFSENGLLTASNINEIIFFNKLKVIKKIYSNEQNEKLKTTNIKPDNIKSDDIKLDDIKLDDIKLDDIKPNDIQLDTIQLDTIQLDTMHPDDIKLDDIKLDDIKPDDIKLDDIKPDNIKPDTIELDTIQLDTIISYDKYSFESLIDENIFMQSQTTKYYNCENIQNKFIFEDAVIATKYSTYLSKRIDKYLIVSTLPKYQFTLLKFIDKYQVYVINNFESIVKKLLKSLALLHHNGFLHGDLKSANILINDSDNISLTDFGAVKIINFDKYHLSCTITSRCPEDLDYENFGTELYSNSNYKSDIWSLGLIFAEMILGYNPILKLYQQIEKTGVSTRILESKLVEYYKTLNYIDILELAKKNPIKNHYSDKLYEQIDVIIQMLQIDPKNRLSSIEEVYEKLFGEKVGYNFQIMYSYDYEKFNTKNKFNILFDIRKHYKTMLVACKKLSILFTCPLIIDILDRLFIKLLDKKINKPIELQILDLNLIFAAVIVLAGGITNQIQPCYKDILIVFNILNNDVNIGILNNNLLKILELMNYDIIRPFNIFYCTGILGYNKCHCVKLKEYNNQACIIHTKEENNILLSVLNDIIDNNIIGVSPEYYYEKMKQKDITKNKL